MQRKYKTYTYEERVAYYEKEVVLWGKINDIAAKLKDQDLLYESCFRYEKAEARLHNLRTYPPQDWSSDLEKDLVLSKRRKKAV